MPAARTYCGKRAVAANKARSRLALANLAQRPPQPDGPWAMGPPLQGAHWHVCQCRSAGGSHVTRNPGLTFRWDDGMLSQASDIVIPAKAGIQDLSLLVDHQPRLDLADALTNGGHDTGRIQPALREQLLRIAMVDELVRQAQLQQRLHDAGSGHGLGYR